jgi:hypothetical protein
MFRSSLAGPNPSGMASLYAAFSAGPAPARAAGDPVEEVS